MIWYVENPLRFRQERESLDRLASSSDWLIPGEWRIDTSLRIAWDADILVDGVTRPVTLRFPNHYPHSPPLVLPRDPTARWSGHQYGAGGELCLEFGPDNWHEDLLGTHMIESAHRLLQGEAPTTDHSGLVASRHATTLGQDLRDRVFRLLMTRESSDCLATIPEQTPVPGILIAMFHKECNVYVIGSLSTPGGIEWVDPSVPKPLKDVSYEQKTFLIRWPANFAVPSPSTASAFRIELGLIDATSVEVRYVLICHGSDIYAYYLSSDDTVYAIKVIPAQPTAKRVDESHSSLVERKVAIVGCGSLGSKFAVMLARSGVGKFLLVDDDILLPDNLIRHDLDWREVGTHKTAAVARRIQLVNPDAECKTRQLHLGGQESSGSIEILISSLATCDLIVDATADPRAFGYLTAAASTGTKPLLWAEVFGGGFGGLIARHRPSLEPDPASMRRAIENWCRDKGQPIERTANDYANNGAGTPLVADDADVTVIAAHAARLAIDTLIPRNPSMFPNSVYMIGLAGHWNFSQPFETYPIDVGGPNPKLISTPVDEKIANEEKELVLGLFSKLANSNSTNSTDSSTLTT